MSPDRAHTVFLSSGRFGLPRRFGGLAGDPSATLPSVNGILALLRSRDALASAGRLRASHSAPDVAASIVGPGTLQPAGPVCSPTRELSAPAEPNLQGHSGDPIPGQTGAERTLGSDTHPISLASQVAGPPISGAQGPSREQGPSRAPAGSREHQGAGRSTRAHQGPPGPTREHQGPPGPPIGQGPAVRARQGRARQSRQGSRARSVGRAGYWQRR